MRIILYRRLETPTVLGCTLSKIFFGINLSYAFYLQEKAGITISAKIPQVPLPKFSLIELCLKLKKLKRPIEKTLHRRIDQSVHLLKINGCYRGLRMKQFLPNRGQRTKTNARTCKRKNVLRNVSSKKQKDKIKTKKNSQKVTKTTPKKTAPKKIQKKK